MMDKKIMLAIGDEFGSEGGIPHIPYYLQWKLDDSAANAVVVGSEVNGEVIGGNSADVAATLGGSPAFHLNGSTQYVRITVPTIWPGALLNLWTKYSGNPVNTLAGYAFSHLCKNPAGGWYDFTGRSLQNIYRMSSTDLITWTGGVQVLAKGAAGSWDAAIEVACVFQKPDNSWIMLYRGELAGVFKIGLATSADGTTWTRKNNGGVDDGLFPQFGNNTDPTEVLLVGSRYYVYVNGDPNHGTQHVYYSDDDFITFTKCTNSPIFSNQANSFCAGVWRLGDYYYALVARDINAGGATLYDHLIGLYRSTVPEFTLDTTSFLGYAIVNDQSYDQAYLDTPSSPFTDVYRTIYGPEFGNTFYALYSGRSGLPAYSANLASTPISSLLAQPVRLDRLYKSHIKITCNVQFDSLASQMSILSFGSTPNDGTPVFWIFTSTQGANQVLSIYAGSDYRYTSQILAINTPYALEIDHDLNLTTFKVNGVLVGSFAFGYNTAVDATYIYLGQAYPGTKPLDGYIWDFRIYPK